MSGVGGFLNDRKLTSKNSFTLAENPILGNFITLSFGVDLRFGTPFFNTDQVTIKCFGNFFFIT